MEQVENEILTQQDLIYQTLCDDVLAGHFSPDQKITLDELSHRFGVSNMPIRDALRRLAETGTIVVRPKRAVRFATLSLEEFDEILDMRLALETLATRSAVAHIREQDLNLLEGLAERADRVLGEGRWTEYPARNAVFHTELYALSRRPLLCKTIHNLSLRLGPYIRFWGAQEANEGRDRHFNIVAVLRRREADAAAAILAADIRAGMMQVRAKVFDQSKPS